MLKVSLHNISIQSKRGLYKEEQELYNRFEVDVDVYMAATDSQELAFVDYTVIRAAVSTTFERPHKLLEHFIRDIYHDLKERYPESEKIRITIRKLNPPMEGETGYAQVVYEG